jgi:hypothetical protein
MRMEETCASLPDPAASMGSLPWTILEEATDLSMEVVAVSVRE